MSYENQVVRDVTPEESKQNEIIQRIIDLKARLDANKPLYEELDRLVLELKGTLGVSNEVTAFDHYVEVVDNFAEKNTVFRPCGVKRFEVKIESLVDRLAKAEKRRK